jgi:hypothetical protein
MVVMGSVDAAVAIAEAAGASVRGAGAATTAAALLDAAAVEEAAALDDLALASLTGAATATGAGAATAMVATGADSFLATFFAGAADDLETELIIPVPVEVFDIFKRTGILFSDLCGSNF